MTRPFLVTILMILAADCIRAAAQDSQTPEVSAAGTVEPSHPKTPGPYIPDPQPVKTNILIGTITVRCGKPTSRRCGRMS